MDLSRSTPNSAQFVAATLATLGTQALGAGATPTHYFDFMNNRALFAGADVGTISSIPGLTGTPALSAAGHTISSSGTCLNVATPAVPFPLTMFIEFVRVSDLGIGERILTLDDGSESNRTIFQINANDTIATSMANATVAQFAVSTAAATVGPTYKLAARYKQDDCISCLNGTIGTQDTSATVPSTLTVMRIGNSFTGSNVPSIIVRKVAFFNSGLTDAQLQTMTT